MTIFPFVATRSLLQVACFFVQSAVVYAAGFDDQIKNNSLAISPNETVAVVSYSDEPNAGPDQDHPRALAE